MPMTPYKGELDGSTVTLACIHWRTFPPLEVLEGDTPTQLWHRGEITDRQFQQIQIWERECGLTRMDDARCRRCKHLRWLKIRQAQAPMLVSLDGKLRTPIADQTMLASLSKYRGNINVKNRPHGSRHSTEDAAWVKTANEGKSGG